MTRKLEWILNTTAADEVRFDLCNVNSLCPGTSWVVVQFKIHSCFRTEVLTRNQHTLILKLALVDTVYTPMARVVQINIHSCFRTEVHPRNQHTLIPKLALVDTVYTPMARVRNKFAGRDKIDKDIIWNCLRIFSMRCDWNLAKTQFGSVLEYFRWIEVGHKIFLSRRREKRNWT